VTFLKIQKLLTGFFESSNPKNPNFLATHQSPSNGWKY